jgi:hypothetical protein
VPRFSGERQAGDDRKAEALSIFRARNRETGPDASSGYKAEHLGVSFAINAHVVNNLQVPT